jgi:hypothetical protein
VKDLLLARKLVKNMVVQIVDIIVLACKNDTFWKVFIRVLKGIIDSRINSINEGWDSVFKALEVIRKVDVGALVSMTTLFNLQLPLCKVALLRVVGVQLHVDFEVEDLDVSPKNGTLQWSTHNLRTCAPLDDWQNLVKVTSKNDTDATEWLIRVVDITKCSIDWLMQVTVLHKGLIPNDQVCYLKEFTKLWPSRDWTGGRLIDLNRDVETGMGSAATFKQKSCNARGCDTDDDFALRMKAIAEGVVDIGFAYTTWTMEKEGLAGLVDDCLQDFLKDGCLVWIEVVLMLCCQNCLLLNVIAVLLCNVTVVDLCIPILSHLRHVWPIYSEGLFREHEKLIDEIKAIILDISIGGVDTKVALLKVMAQVITDVRPVCVPKLNRIWWGTVAKNSDKEIVKLMTCCHGPCLLQTLLPLLIVLQKAMCEACLSKWGSDNVLKSAEVLIRGCTLDSSEKEPEVEVFTGSGLSIVHPPDGKSALSGLPLVCLLIPHKLWRKVLVRHVLCKLWILLVGLEVASKGGVMFCSIIGNLLDGLLAILIPGDILLAWKIDLEADDVGESAVHEKVEEAPDTLTGWDIASIKILFDLIIASTELHGDTIMALVDILVDVFDGLDRCNGLEIDMTTILPDEIGTVCDDLAIVDLLSTNLMCLPSVPRPGWGIGILGNGGLISEGLWEILAALAIL